MFIVVGTTLKLDADTMPEPFDTTALNGVGSFDAHVLQRWGRPDHKERMRPFRA
jgi:hypothetical protein